jgi:hypothetical protein
VARVSGPEIARWAATAGWRIPNLEVAVAIGLANGSDPAKPGGVWGVGGPAGDGLGQARAAYAQWRQQGWDEFPAWSSGAWRLYIPSAAIAVAAAGIGGIIDRTDDVVDQAADAGVSTLAGPFKPAIDLAAYVGTDEFWNRAIKIGLGVTLLIIAAGSIAWTGATRPIFQAVGVLDKEVDRAATKLVTNQQARGIS